jgi:hypothetical protein
MKNVLTELDRIFSENQKHIEVSFHPLISLCKDMLNSQYWMFSSFAGLLQNPIFIGYGKSMKATCYAAHGNFFHFYASLYLAERGYLAQLVPC